MRLSAPTKKVFWISVVLAVLAVAAFVATYFVELSWLGLAAFVVLAVAYLLVVLGNTLKGF